MAIDTWRLIKEEFISDPSIDIASICDRFGVPEERLRRLIVTEGWMKLRKERQDNLRDTLEAFSTTSLVKDAKELTRIRRKMFEQDIDLVESKIPKLVETMDALLENGEMKPSDVLKYLQLLLNKRQQIQETIAETMRRLGEDQEQDEVVQSIIHPNILTPSEMLNLIENPTNPVDNPFGDDMDEVLKDVD